MENILRKSLSTIALTTLTGLASAGVNFQIIGGEYAPDEPKWSNASVANDGTVLIKKTVGYAIEMLRWTEQGGLSSVQDGTGFGPHISDDGDYMWFWGTQYDYHTPEGVLNVDNYNNSNRTLHAMSGNGKVLAGYANSQINYYNDGVWQNFNTPIANMSLAGGFRSLSSTGELILTKVSDGNGGFDHYLLDNQGVHQVLPVDFKQTIAISGDGKNVIGTIDGLNPTCSSGTSNVIYNVDAGLKEIGCTEDFKMYDLSGDGSTVIGYLGNIDNVATSHIWTEAAGLRNLQDVLVGAGYNVRGWSSFAATDISENGLVITGVGTNENGESRGFMMQVVQECVVGF